MKHYVHAINGRLSLRPPQRESLEILDRVMEMAQPHKNGDAADALAIIRQHYPTVTDFEREFPSLCFALATGVGKTRLMGAFIAYLRLAHGLRNFFVLAPNLTIYNKLITDFTPNTSKYVFRGIAEFATTPPIIVTGDNYESGIGTKPSLFAGYGQEITVNIFNISKINTEVRGGKSPRIKRLSEYIGDSYFNYLAELPDLVLLMDESHRYRASAGARAINELKPVLGLELTATPFVETSRGAVAFKNVIYDYPLAKALQDGFVKEPAVVTQKNFQPQNHTLAELEQIKLEDGIRLHENTKVELETYARQTGQPIVKPFMLVIARDTTHAAQLLGLMESEAFFNGRYQNKVIQVDSTTKEEEVIERLLAVESADEPTEIVIHVNMLKEGWDVTNLYTIVPLRAANARILIEQSIGRGLRLPYGKRTGVRPVDRLSIVAHDKFQEIVDEANRPDSVIRLEQIILEPETTQQRMQTVVAEPTLLQQWSKVPSIPASAEKEPQLASPPAVFQTAEDRQIARLTYEVIQNQGGLPSTAALGETAVRAKIIKEVTAAYTPPAQPTLPGLAASPPPDIGQIVQQVTEIVRQNTIDIPRIVVVPTGELTSGFHPFRLDTSNVHYQPVDRDLLIQTLHTNAQESLHMGGRIASEERLEDYLVRQLVDFPDISYDDQADLLYELAADMISHLQSYLATNDEVLNVVLAYQKPLARLIHAQMQPHRWEKVAGYEARVTQGFTPLKQSAFTAEANQPVQDIHMPPADKSKIRRLVFGNFSRCLYSCQKFDSDTERKLAVILERESEKWFKPALGQFQIYYKLGLEQKEYQPDFVAETTAMIYLLETKAVNELNREDVLAKRDAAVTWCQYATEHALAQGGKRWQYALIPHDVITENMTLVGLVQV
ncbi:MAG: DEAD/DEAH box helicase family protein [Ardenticatenaceae bacterium]|nr:DEAD/DEAH box helicase family protein [Ardenticatenaceae bacterium]